MTAATPAEVDAHYASSRPSETQTPERDLTVTSITALSDIGFADWTAFGVKAANVAVLGKLGFPAGTVPDGFAIPFYFYDEFMKHNDFYDDIDEMLADHDFQTDFDKQEDDLKDLRKAIEKAETPEWIIDAIEEMNEGFLEGINRRYRSSTNNEGLPGFNGAGLYDSKSQKPSEDEEDLAKSLKEVYASLWNFRAFTEREFHRIDHKAAAMGILIHPSYRDELANGVVVSFDPITEEEGSYYVNTQIGEDLVTNPDAHSVPEELLLRESGRVHKVIGFSNQVERGELLLDHAEMNLLRDRLEVIHEKFEELYEPGPDEPFAIEIEFKITSEDVLAIKQARPWVFSHAQEESEEPANRPATGAPTISGTAQVTETLTADTSGIADEDGLDDATFSYQWLAGGVDIQGATASAHTLTGADEGKAITVQVSFTDDAGHEESLTSTATAAVAARPNAPANGAPTISGTVQVGETLTAYTSGIVDEDGLDNVSYGYQWIADDADIQGATVSTYTLTERHEGKAIKVKVTFIDDADNEETLTSTATAAVAARPNNPATGAPTIGGTAQVGETLTADTSGISDEDGLDNVSYSYQWIADDADIRGAAASTYTLTDADEGKTVKVQVSFTDDAGNEESLTSEATTTVTEAALFNSPATGAPTVRGTAQVGKTLTASKFGVKDADGMRGATVRYQWMANDGSTDTDIQGATSSSYTLTDADAGATIRVRMSFTDGQGHDETLNSAPTEPVVGDGPPGAPRNLTVTPEDRELIVSWEPPEDNGKRAREGVSRPVEEGRSGIQRGPAARSEGIALYDHSPGQWDTLHRPGNGQEQQRLRTAYGGGQRRTRTKGGRAGNILH